jgi:hypothetical protein
VSKGLHIMSSDFERIRHNICIKFIIYFKICINDLTAVDVCVKYLWQHCVATSKNNC